MSAKQTTPEGDDLDSARRIAMATMGPEEIEAMNAEQLSDADRKNLKAIAGQDDDEDEDEDDDTAADEDEDDDEGDDEAAGEAKGAPKSEAKAADDEIPNGDGATDDEPGEEDAPTFKPKFKAELPEDYADQVSALDAADADLIKKFKGGDIEVDEFVTEQRRIADKRSELRSIKDRSETFEAMNAQTAEQEWAHAVDRFFGQTKKGEKIDYRGKPELLNDFDTFVKALAGKEENANKPFSWFLTEAHKRTKALHGLGTATPQAKTDEKPAKSGKPARKPPTDAIPASVAGIAGSEGPGDVDDEFADLDALDGLEYEKALAKLTPEQRDRYRMLA